MRGRIRIFPVLLAALLLLSACNSGPNAEPEFELPSFARPGQEETGTVDPVTGETVTAAPGEEPGESGQEPVGEEPTAPAAPVSVVNILLPEASLTLDPKGEHNLSQRLVLDALYLRGAYRISGKTVSDLFPLRENLGGGVWRLTLREGVRDSRGNPLLAEDAMACLEREGLSLEKLSDLSLRLTIEDTAPFTLDTLLRGTYFYTRAGAAAGGSLPPATGAYTLSEESRDRIILSRVEEPWFAGMEDLSPVLSAQADRLHFDLVPDAGTRLQRTRNGEGDLVLMLGAQAAEVAETRAMAVSRTLPGDRCLALFFHMDPSRVCAKRVEIRRALALALNPGAYLEESGALALTAQGILPQATEGYTPGNALKRDLESAKTLLSKARYNTKTELQLLMTEEDRPVAEAIQAQCAEAGIKLVLNPVPDVKAAAEAGELPWDLALAPVEDRGNAALSYAEVFRRGAEGTTWFGFANEDVLFLTDLLGTQGGGTLRNVELMTDWLTEDPVVIGYLTPGYNFVLYAEGLEVVLCDNLPIPGSLSPRRTE